MRPSLWRAAKAPFKVSGKSFDALLPKAPKPKKAWDGQDKDAFFRDKYAHVHAKQVKNRPARKQSKKEPTEKSSSGARDVLMKRTRDSKHFESEVKQLMARDRRIEYLFGSSCVEAALTTRHILKVYTGHSPEHVKSDILGLCVEKNIPLLYNTSVRQLNILTDNAVHNKYVAQVHKREFPSVSTLVVEDGTLVLEEPINSKRTHPFGIFLDEITDPHNMGAILRSAYWFGVDFVAVSQRNSAPISPQVVKSSSAAAEFVPILSVPQPLAFMDSLQPNWKIVAAVPTKSSLPHIEPEELGRFVEEGPTLLLIGSEGDGLRKSLAQRSTHSVSLSSFHTDPKIDSLNVSVATALLLSSLGQSPT